MLNIEWLSRILGAGYPTIITSWVFPLAIGLVSLSMPILVSNIQRVEKKFKRYHVGGLLQSNGWVICYFVLVVLTLLAIVVYLLQIPRSVEWGYKINMYIDHSAELLVILTSTLLLVSVLIVIQVIIRYTTKTQSIYRNNKRRIKRYFRKIACLHKRGKYTYEKDEKIAKKKKFYQLVAVIETVIEEHDLDFIDQILEDFSKYVEFYRTKYAAIQPRNRHILVEYPYAFTKALQEIARVGFEKPDTLSQQQVYFFVVNTLFDIPNSDNFDIPKNGLSIFTLKTLWKILIDATNQNKTEYIQLYWAAIFEYTKRMFHAPAITTDPKKLRDDIIHYDLTEEDKFEQALIAHMHFMWMAYLYEQQNYKVLKDVMEYYNGYTDVEELNFFSLDRALKIYSMKDLLNNTYAKTIELDTVDKIVSTFSYYTYMSTSEIEKQKRILANYMSFLVHLHYNKWKDVPICSRNNVSLSWPSDVYLESALKQQVALPGMRVYNFTLKQCMTNEDVETFMRYIKPRSDFEEYSFTKETTFRNLNMEILFSEIKRGVTFDLTRREFLWIDNANHINSTDYRENDVEIVLKYDFPRKVMLYNDIEHDYTLLADIAKQFLSKINEQVMLSYYRAHAKRKVTSMRAEDLSQNLLGKNDNERAILFAQDIDQILHYKYLLLGTSDEQLEWITLTEDNKHCSIKSILLPSGNSKLSTLENQLWVIPKDLQPVVQFEDIQNKEGWTLIHEYAKKTEATKDRLDMKFAKIPIYVKFEDIPDKDDVPMIRLRIISKAKIFGAKRLHIKVFRLK